MLIRDYAWGDHACRDIWLRNCIGLPVLTVYVGIMVLSSYLFYLCK